MVIKQNYLKVFEHRRLIHDLIVCYRYLHGLIDTDNTNFWCVPLLLRTRNSDLKLYKAHCNTDALMQESVFLPIALLTFGTLYLQQSFLVIMSLLLNTV